MFSMLIAGTVLEIYELGDIQICLTDYPGEGNSENDTSENSEDNSEMHCFKPSENRNVLLKKFHHAKFDNWIKQEYFTGIPHPPPEEV